MRSETLEECIKKYGLFLLNTGIDEEFRKTLDHQIKEYGMKVKEKKIDGKTSFFDIYFADDRIKRIIVDAMKRLENNDLSFVPDSNAPKEFARYFQEQHNQRAEKFFLDTLPSVFKDLGIKLNEFDESSIRYMDSYSEYLKEHVRKNYNPQDGKDKEYIIGLLGKQSYTDIKSINIVSYTPKNHSKSSVVRVAIKAKDRSKRASKLRKLMLNCLGTSDESTKLREKKFGFITYSKAKKLARTNMNGASLDDMLLGKEIIKNMKLPYSEFLIGDNFGFEIEYQEGKEKEYTKLFSNPRYITLEVKTEGQFVGMEKHKGKGLIEPRYNQRFKHTRIKFYDTKTKVIVDAHFTNLPSKIIKDFCPGVSHLQKDVSMEFEQGKRHKQSRKIVSHLDGFLYNAFLRRGYSLEMEYFSKPTIDARRDYSLHMLNVELQRNFTSEQISVFENANIQNAKSYQKLFQTLNIDNDTLLSKGRESDLSIVLDLLLHNITETLYASSKDYVIDKVGVHSYKLFVDESDTVRFTPSLDNLLTYALKASKIHTILYDGVNNGKGVDEGKDWKERKDDINEIYTHLERLRLKKERVNKTLFDAVTNAKDYHEAFSKINEAVSIIYEKGPITHRDILVKLDRQVIVDSASDIFSAYSELRKKHHFKLREVPKEIRDRILENYWNFEDRVSGLKVGNIPTASQIERYDSSILKFEKDYKIHTK